MTNFAPSAMTLESMVLGINADACLNDLMTNAVNLKVTNYIFYLMAIKVDISFHKWYVLAFGIYLQFAMYKQWYVLFMSLMIVIAKYFDIYYKYSWILCLSTWI